MDASPFERQRRGAARIALYTSLVVSAALLLLFLSHLATPTRYGRGQDWYTVDYEALPEVRWLRQYASIDTTPTTGNELDGARFLAEELEAAGIPVHIERLANDRANLWAVLEGEERQALVLHHHIDVEPIHKPQYWTHDPFGSEIDPPWIYGRGVFDMKSVAIAQLAALIELKASGLPLKRSVIFLATSSEETGSDLGTRWILRQHPELVERFWAVLSEGGWLELRSVEDLKFWGVEFAQKRFVDLILCSDSLERLESLREDLFRTGYPTTGLVLTDDVRTFLETYAPTRDLPFLREVLETPETVLLDPAAFEQLPNYIRSLFRNEAVAFPPRPAEGGGYEMLVKLHLLHGADLEAVRRELMPDWLLQGVSVIRPDPDPPHPGSPVDHPVFREATAVLRENFPGATVGPLFLPWTATDSRFFRAAGIPSYGFSPFLIFTSDTLHVSGPEERISLPGYVEGVRLYKLLLKRLVAKTP